ncbi:MAG: formylglycine-generating enzyme family protein, partial [Thermoguttaceae bacterium]|nr:formylglycine-generating enzyme family protein [Thermoguttaceae bacterium]
LASLVVVCAARSGLSADGPRRNAHYLAPPAQGEDYRTWLAGLNAYRQAVRTSLHQGAGFDDTMYRRADQAWMTRNFVCGFLFVYDRAFWDPDHHAYRVGALCDEAQRDFGGYDSVVLWHAYPRIGADSRNQFDFFRDMPGGLDGVREVVRQFHARGVKVFLPYNPWDTGTRREPEPDEQALARLVAALEVDGLFLDTMAAAPGGLRRAVDAVRPGVAFEPEGHPTIDETEHCTGSWAQWLQPFPGIGVLHLKWIEPRHMQHQIRRWDKSHQDELAAAWLNGSGILVWENIFGYWNPWNAEDRATLRRMAPVRRHFATTFAQGQWLPCFPTRVDRVHASCWQAGDVRLWTLLNETGRTLTEPALELDDTGERFFDLWRGAPIEAKRVEGKVRLAWPLERFGAVLAVGPNGDVAPFAPLMAKQRDAAALPLVRPEDDRHVRALPVLDPKPAPAVTPRPDGALGAAGMLKVEGGRETFVVRHMRRECGCYPDPDTPPRQWDRFLIGTPHEQVMEHRITVTLAPYRIDPRPVTNAQFEAFLSATKYTPRCRDKFLHHWGGPVCPAELRDKPVVYVDLDDARAYAAWAGKRLPTEWEWQQAAQRHGAAFDRAEVFE